MRRSPFRSPAIHALAAAGLVTTLAPSCKSLNCTEVDCGDGLTIEGHVKASAASLVHGHVTFCHEADCSTGEIGADDAGTAASDRIAFLDGDGRSMLTFVDETDGWLLIRVTFGFKTPAKDGDRQRLTIADAKGATLLDVARGVHYTTFAPNGEACGPICKGGLVELWPESKSDITCSADWDQCGVTLTVHPTFTGEDAIGAVLEVCRNDVCVKDAPYFNASGPNGLSGLLSSDKLVTHFTSRHASGDRFDLKFLVVPEPAVIADGDVYRVSVTTKDGRVLAQGSTTATYARSFPDGAECDANACGKFEADLM